MNFGHWIVVAFVGFAIFIGVLVTVCVREDISLVSKDYYREELDYQEQIKRINNTTALVEKPSVKRIDSSTVQITLSQQLQVKNGRVKFFCPADPRMDRNYTLDTNDVDQRFDTSSFRKGMYKVKLTWEMEGKEFYYEEIINI